MKRLSIQEPSSGGILLSYKCTGECKHCMYACSPRWRGDWISEEDAQNILSQLSGKIRRSPFGSDRLGINYGLHFTGGEPFLNFDLLLRLTRIAYELEIPSTFVETNCFWCVDDETTREKLNRLKASGLNGVLISANPFILEQIPFERTERAVKTSKEVFGRNALIYQEFFYRQFKCLNLKNILPFKQYLKMADPSSLYNVELIPMGRAPYRVAGFYKKYPAKHFFGESCIEELTRGWHVHIDNYRNYVTGYCGGISLGDARDLSSLYQGIDLEDRPILDALLTDLEDLYKFGIKEFGYKESPDGYISKCHICVDVRRHIAQQTDEFKELQPREFYRHLV